MAYNPNGIQIEGGGVQGLPTINKDWISYQDATPAQWSGSGDNQYQTQAAKDAGYWFDWTKSGGAQPDELKNFYNNDNAHNYEWSFDPQTGAPSARIKSGDKTGTTVKYKKDASGNWVPDYGDTSAGRWDTNESQRGWQPIAAVIGAGFGAGYGAEALGLGAVGGEAGGLTALGTGDVALGTAANTGLIDAGTMAGVEAGGTAAGGASGLTELGTGAVEPLSSAPTIAEAQQPWWQTAYDYAKTANEYKGYYDKANKAYNMINPQDQQMRHYDDSEPGGSSAGIPNTSGGGFDWNTAGKVGGTLADLYGAWYSGQQLKDQAGNEKAPFSRQNGLQDPYNMMLQASYINPETYYGTSQWKGLKDVYQNSIDRTAARGGTLANPTDREVKLNNYAMKSLEDYRTGLRGAVNAYDASKYNQMYSSGLSHEANANTGAFATASKGQTAGQVKQYIDTAKSAYDIWQEVGKWFT